MESLATEQLALMSRLHTSVLNADPPRAPSRRRQTGGLLGALEGHLSLACLQCPFKDVEKRCQCTDDALNFRFGVL